MAESPGEGVAEKPGEAVKATSMTLVRRNAMLSMGLVLAVLLCGGNVDAADGRVLGAAPASASPAAESAMALVDRAFRNLYAEDYVHVLTLTTSSSGSRDMTKKLQITRRQSVRPGKALLRFLAPESIRRTSVLILENERASDDLYVYLPDVRLTRHLAASQRADSFFGTDLSYEDVEPKHVEDWRITELGEGEAFGEPCALVELRAAEGYESAYDTTISCIERKRAIIMWSDFHRYGSVVKRLEIDPEHVKPVGDRYIPFLMTMKTMRTQSETRVTTETYELRDSIPDALFSTWNLEAGDARRDRANAGKRPSAPVQPVREDAPSQ